MEVAGFAATKKLFSLEYSHDLLPNILLLHPELLLQ